MAKKKDKTEECVELQLLKNHREIPKALLQGPSRLTIVYLASITVLERSEIRSLYVYMMKNEYMRPVGSWWELTSKGNAYLTSLHPELEEYTDNIIGRQDVSKGATKEAVEEILKIISKNEPLIQYLYNNQKLLTREFITMFSINKRRADTMLSMLVCFGYLKRKHSWIEKTPAMLKFLRIDCKAEGYKINDLDGEDDED